MSEAWRIKINGNRARDERVSRRLEEAGWMVIRVPEHAIRSKAGLEETILKLAKLLGELPAPGTPGTDEGDQ
jgi:G:T-mismatch repair DNA endonuclease (very short patch repair protein)